MNADRERRWKTLAWSNLWNNYACRLKWGDCWDLNHDKIEFQTILDDVVFGLSPTQCDVSSDLTDENMASWQRQRYLSSSPTSGDTYAKRADRLLEKTETPKFMSNICGVVTGRKSTSEGEFLRTGAFMTQNDIQSMC